MDETASRRCNIELKARLADLDAACAVALEIGAEFQGLLRQRDTYFNVPSGRLKLRETDGAAAELIWYERGNETDSRASRYYLVPAPQPELLAETLRSALGVRAVVTKSRQLFLWKNVRIHLDRVEGRGTFLEFEAVLEPGQPEADGHRLIAELRERFGIEDADLVGGSYADMPTTEPG